MKKILLLILSSTFFLYAETHITGNISEMQFDASGNPFIVEQDILIPEGKKVVIGEGCVFLFKAFTGLHVQGQLVVKGSTEKPVVFSSVNDGEYNSKSEQLPNPFDWNGILVSRESGIVSFSNFILRYSVYGIKSQNPNIQIENGLFRQNGQFHFTLNDKIQFVQDNLPYSYNQSSDKSANGATTQVADNSQNQKKKSSKGVRIFRYTSLGVGVAGVLAGAAFGILSAGAYNDMSNASDKRNTDDSYTNAQNKYNKDLPITIVGGVLGVLGLAGFGISFAF